MVCACTFVSCKGYYIQIVLQLYSQAEYIDWVFVTLTFTEHYASSKIKINIILEQNKTLISWI
jgi:hypothetical protein